MNIKTYTNAFIALGLLVCGLPASAALTEDEVQKLLRDGKGFTGSGRYDLARRRYEQVIKLEPTNREAHVRLQQVIRQEAVQQKARDAETKMVRPTYPPQHLGTVPGLPLFK